MTDEPKLTGQLKVGAVRFNPGVKLSTVQGAIDRLVEYAKGLEKQRDGRK